MPSRGTSVSNARALCLSFPARTVNNSGQAGGVCVGMGCMEMLWPCEK